MSVNLKRINTVNLNFSPKDLFYETKGLKDCLQKAKKIETFKFSTVTPNLN